MNRRPRRALAGALAGVLAAAVLAGAAPAQPPNPAVLQRIRAEGAHSEISHTIHVLTDVDGPRLTGSANARRAAAWARGQLAAWGLSNAHLEPWDFGHPGWSGLRARGEIVAPVRAPLHFAVSAWTPGTAGVVRARAVHIDPPRTATRGQLAEYLASHARGLRGRIVLVGPGTPTGPNNDPFPARFDDKALAEIYRPTASAQPEAAPDPSRLTRSQWNRQVNAFLLAHRAALRIDDAHLPEGLVNATYNDTFDLARAPPWVTLRNDDFGRIARLLADGRPVRLVFDIRNAVDPAGRNAYNVVAELPGGDKAGEVVAIGAHLDSWHLATGATDNAAGCAIMMEAMRILSAIGVRPRRTIRIVLFTGEEQGLYGSQAYVARHFGTAEHPLEGFGRLDAYVNIDGGSGRVRGANVFGPPPAAEALHELLAPFADLGVAGTVAHAMRRLRSTDATTFSRAGLPAVGLLQDPLENGLAWHSEFDTYERISDPDTRQAAIVVAGFAYGLAMRDAPMPRFAPGEMPKPVGPPPVPNAAAVCGFADQSHLTRHFVRRLGHTPGEFSKKCRSGEIAVGA